MRRTQYENLVFDNDLKQSHSASAEDKKEEDKMRDDQ